MFKFVCKSRKILAYEKSSFRTTTFHKLQSIQLSPISTETLNKSLSNAKINENPHSFTVNYLIKSCSLTQKGALSASKYVILDTPDKPDSVLALFKKHGFDDCQVSSVIARYPRVLLCHPEKTLLPKIEFFKSLGFSSLEIAKLLDSRINLVTRSLEYQIIPSFGFLTSLVTYKEDVVSTIKQCPEILTRKYQILMVANIGILRQLGVPEPNIVATVKHLPRLLMTSSERVKEAGKKLDKMGLHPRTMVFVRCLWAMSGMSKLIWKDKLAVYKSWDCSEDEVLMAFKKHPCCMTVSVDKITDVMEFLVHKMGYSPSDILRAPVIFSLSLKKNFVPRFAVYNSLLAKGLIRKAKSLATLLVWPERKFLKRFVEEYEKEAPDLLEIYLENRKLSK